MPKGHDTTNEVSNSMSFVLYTQILKQSVQKPASPGITLNNFFYDQRCHGISRDIFCVYLLFNNLIWYVSLFLIG